jgi:hypothetical protein
MKLDACLRKAVSVFGRFWSSCLPTVHARRGAVRSQRSSSYVSQSIVLILHVSRGRPTTLTAIGVQTDTNWLYLNSYSSARSGCATTPVKFAKLNEIRLQTNRQTELSVHAVLDRHACRLASQPLALLSCKVASNTVVDTRCSACI